MEHAIDLDGGHGRARDGRQQRAAQGVAEGVAETGLERLDDELRTVGVDVFLGQLGRCEMSMCFSFVGNHYLMPVGTGAGKLEDFAPEAVAPGRGRAGAG